MSEIQSIERMFTHILAEELSCEICGKVFGRRGEIFPYERYGRGDFTFTRDVIEVYYKGKKYFLYNELDDMRCRCPEHSTREYSRHIRQQYLTPTQLAEYLTGSNLDELQPGSLRYSLLISALESCLEGLRQPQ